MSRPTVLGIDPGEHNTAFGVLGDGEILDSRLLMYRDCAWELRCSLFKEEIETCLALYNVDVLAIEDYVWHGHHADVEHPIRELIGITRSFARATRILVIRHDEWAKAITGQNPAKKDAFEGSRRWKQIIREALALHLRAMGIDLDLAVGPDKGNHRTDALALSLYCQNLVSVMRFAHVEG